MKRIALTLLITAALVAACRDDAPRLVSAAPGIAGRWEPTVISRGSLGAVLDLADDGTLVTGYVALVDGTYTLEGNRLTTEMYDGSGTHSEVTFDGETMTEKDEEDYPEFPIPYRRVGSVESGVAPIVGVWGVDLQCFGVEAERAADWNSFLRARKRFTNDGRFMFRVVLGGEAGNWTFEGGVLTVTVGDSTNRLTVERVGDVLTLTRETEPGNPLTYVRTDRWYEFEPMTVEQAREFLRQQALEDE